jgi:hypothetical protein
MCQTVYIQLGVRRCHSRLVSVASYPRLTITFCHWSTQYFVQSHILNAIHFTKVSVNYSTCEAMKSYATGRGTLETTPTSGSLPPTTAQSENSLQPPDYLSGLQLFLIRTETATGRLTQFGLVARYHSEDLDLDTKLETSRR